MYKVKDTPPIVGILANCLPDKAGRFIGMERCCVSREYVDGVLRAGGIPLLLPILSDIFLIERQTELLDAFVFSGGQDVQPHLYHEEPSPFLEAVHPERDAYELAVLRCALAQNKPILGICRGMQLVNIALGGTLYQDIGRCFPASSLNHNQDAPRNCSVHTVRIVPGTRLSSILCTELLETNSFHHQGVKQIGKGLIPSAFSSDGVVEAVEGSGILAVQWHPEMMAAEFPAMQRLFDDLILRAAHSNE